MGKLRSIIGVVLLITLLMVSTVLFAFQGSLMQVSGNKIVFQKGMSYATYANLVPNAYGNTESDESLRRMRLIGVEWVAINVVGWYQTNNKSADIHKNPNQAPTDEALAHVIETAHSLNMNVMLKPMIDLEDGCWRGEIQPSKEWFENYTSYIGFFAQFAEQHGVDMLCIGTELNRTVSWETEWRNVISSVRQKYSGPLTYAANWWREYDELIQWWDALDYVGINAYFPLSSKNDPTINEMKATWENITNYLDKFYAKIKKPIIFTEIGYLSTDGTNKDPSNYKLQNEVGRLIDLQEQADCYEAAFQVLWNKSWFYGMYWWYWQTNPDAGGPYNSDYTPQNKPAQGVLTHWYLSDNLRTSERIEYTTYIIVGLSAVVVFESIALAILLLRRRKPRVT
ncbi:hypothetical protein DRO69_00080 [Candidatus Bathyarchaeota archaeon]|nr:MAG: hypothetical protein DRO69_00080 [Candidatus Bathyarchaeota archaeon]